VSVLDGHGRRWGRGRSWEEIEREKKTRTDMPVQCLSWVAKGTLAFSEIMLVVVVEAFADEVLNQ